MTQEIRGSLEYAIVLALAIALCACSASLGHRPLLTPSEIVAGDLGVAARAEGMKENIGWGTLTLFAIPVARVKVEGEPDRALMDQFVDAVKRAGYSAQVIDDLDDPSAADLPILTCSVQKFKFRNYTWFFPLVFNWGTVVMDVSVVKPDGDMLWSKQYEGKGKGWYSFTPPVQKALTNILNQLIADITNPDFKAKIEGAG